MTRGSCRGRALTWLRATLMVRINVTSATVKAGASRFETRSYLQCRGSYLRINSTGLHKEFAAAARVT